MDEAMDERPPTAWELERAKLQELRREAFEQRSYLAALGERAREEHRLRARRRFEEQRFAPRGR